MERQTKRILGLMGAVLLGAALGYGQTNNPQGSPSGPPAQAPGVQGERTFGEIVSVGVDRIEIKNRDGSRQTILVDDQTRYRQGERELQLEDLKPGDHVVLSGRTNADKAVVAVMVRRITEEEIQRFQSSGERAFGEIILIEKNLIKIRNPRQGEQKVAVNEQTEFIKEGQPITLKDLKVGDRIFAVGKQSEGQFVATRVSTGQFRGRGSRRPDQEP